MAGNVWEWTADDHDARNKSLRGGSFRNNAEYCRSALANNADYCRCAFRNWLDPDGRSYYLGFRACVFPLHR
jgi:formylglycine-generating enzyme required for sulfatase activity